MTKCDTCRDYTEDRIWCLHFHQWPFFENHIKKNVHGKDECEYYISKNFTPIEIDKCNHENSKGLFTEDRDYFGEYCPECGEVIVES